MVRPWVGLVFLGLKMSHDELTFYNRFIWESPHWKANIGIGFKKLLINRGNADRGKLESFFLKKNNMEEFKVGQDRYY